MPQQIILRKGTAAAWTAAGSVVLAAGEPGFETDTGRFKIGNGTQAWTALAYAVGTIPVNLADLADVTGDTPSAGQVLKWNGTAWAPAADATGGGGGGGTVTSVSGTGTVSGLTLSGTVTDAGSLTLGGTLSVTAADFSTQAGNTVLIAPNGFSGVPTFRALASGDIPILNQNTTGTADNVTGVVGVGNGGTGVSTSTGSGNVVLSASPTLTGTVSVVGNLNASTLENTTGPVTIDAGSGSVFIRPSTGLTQFGSESLNRNGILYQLFNTYTSGSGYTFAQHHATADAINFTFYRTRGTASAPTAVLVGDDLADITFGGYTGTSIAPGAAISVIVESTISATNIPTKFQFLTNNGSATAARMELSSTGTLKVNNIQALTTNGNLNLLANGTGIVTLPAGSTVGGVAIGSLVIKGTVANNAALLALPAPTLGDTYVVLSPTPTHLWSYNASSTWVDLGEFQGPTGQGVPVGGTAGQVLSKIDGTNYNTEWATLPTVPTTLTDLGISDGTSGQVLTTNGSGTFTFTTVSSGAGDVVGPASATNNAITRYDSTTGKLLKDSLVTVSDTGVITAPSVGSVIPFYFANQAAFPTAATYHGAIAHSHADGKMYFAHSGTWNALANATDIVPNTDTTYSIKASTTTGGANLDLDAGGSGSGIDSVKFASGAGITVSYTDVNTITVASTVTNTDTTYSINAVDGTAGKKIIRLTAGGSGSGDDDVTLVAGTNITLDRVGDEITINSTGGGGSMASRADVVGTTGSIADGATGNIAITGFKAYALLKIVVEHQAWVRIYTDTASRTADASRAEGVDPTPGSGVIAEVITTAAPQTILISPGTIGFNNEGTPTTSIPIAVTNKSGTTRTITVTLTVLQLEA